MWNLGLLKTMKDPKYIVYSDSKIVMIKDLYPKAKYHFLVIPTEDIPSIKNLNCNHISLLEYMDQTAKNYVENNLLTLQFRFGYHSQPSMNRLHLHVISRDMQSDALKTKKHWNSFTTEFFLNSSDVINELKSTGKITIPSDSECENILKRNLKCHRCDLFLSNIPKLKQHLLTHD